MKIAAWRLVLFSRGNPTKKRFDPLCALKDITKFQKPPPKQWFIRDLRVNTKKKSRPTGQLTKV